MQYRSAAAEEVCDVRAESLDTLCSGCQHGDSFLGTGRSDMPPQSTAPLSRFTVSQNSIFSRFVVVDRNLEVWIVVGRTEFDRCHRQKQKSNHFTEHLIHPFVLERHHNLKQKNDDSGEVYIADDHDVKVPKQLKLAQIHISLPVGFRSLLQMSN